MGLVDSDPNTTNRIDPIPQAPDGITERYADGTTAITNKRGTSGGARVSTKDATIVVFDGSYHRISLGLLPDGSFGLIITKEGFNVEDVFA